MSTWEEDLARQGWRGDGACRESGQGHLTKRVMRPKSRREFHRFGLENVDKGPREQPEAAGTLGGT